MSFHPRRKTHHKPIVTGKMKTVRIDVRTVIMVSENIPDDDARANYLSRINRGSRAPVDVKAPIPVPEDVVEEVSMGSLEDLQAIVDETVLPDTE